MKKLTALAQSPVGRVLAVLLGMGVVALLVRQSGPALVWAAVTKAPVFFSVVFLLEFLLSSAESWAVVLLYGEKRRQIPLRELIRVSLFTYSLISILPFGRAAGEASRATMFARYVGVPTAAAAGLRAQALSLLGNTFISVPCGIAVYLLMGPSLLFAGIALHFVLTLLLGAGILLATRHGKMAERLGKLFRRGEGWGAGVDDELAKEQSVSAPMFWICLARVIRIGQRVALLAAVGAPATLFTALGADGINLVASMIGDVIPSQVGVTEAGYAMAAEGLQLTSSEGIAMALLVHVAQILWVGIGFFSPLLAARTVPAPAGE
ncbi:MAG: flippase-like domain-containing protein [Archangiaceae bacterium]|nr:flippase-like domain-containing protein [Archangiaceae bacterium]